MPVYLEIVTEAACLATARPFQSKEPRHDRFRSEYRRGIAWIKSDLEPSSLHADGAHLRFFAEQEYSAP